MAEQAELTPRYAAQAAHLASMTQQQPGYAQLPISPAEFERVYGERVAFTEKGVAALTEHLVEKGIHSDVAAEAAHGAVRNYDLVLVGTPQGVEARYVAPYGKRVSEAIDMNELVSKSMAITTAEQQRDAAIDAADTEELLEKAVGGAGNIYGEGSFAALRQHVIEKGLRPTEADDFVEKSREGLTKKTITDKRGHQVTRWVKGGTPETPGK